MRRSDPTRRLRLAALTRLLSLCPRWRELSLKSLSPARVFAAGALARGALVTNGGFMYEDLNRSPNSGFVFSDLLRLRVLDNGQDAVWEKGSLAQGPSVRYRHAATSGSGGQQLYISGGLFRSELGDAWAVDPGSVAWREPTSEDFFMQDGARGAAAACCRQPFIAHRPCPYVQGRA